MSALNRTPQNTNFLQPSKFILSFGRLPTVQYFCQNANLPGVSVGSTPYATPLIDVPIPGSKLSYGEFSIKFIIDEEIQSWNELYKWFLAIASPTSLADRAHYNNLQNSNVAKPSIFSEATLTIMTALNNPGIRINFHRLFPISLSDINFDTTLSADTIITADASFRYEYFDIVSV